MLLLGFGLFFGLVVLGPVVRPVVVPGILLLLLLFLGLCILSPGVGLPGVFTLFAISLVALLAFAFALIPLSFVFAPFILGLMGCIRWNNPEFSQIIVFIARRRSDSRPSTLFPPRSVSAICLARFSPAGRRKGLLPHAQSRPGLIRCRYD